MTPAARAALMGAACLAAAAAGCTPKKTASAKSSARCANLDPVAAAICNDPSLQKLEGEIAVALNKARGLYPGDPAAAQALDEAHSRALQLRQRAGAPDAISLADALKSERDFLLALAPPRDGFTGRWLSPQGDILVSDEPNGFDVHAIAAEKTRGAWMCEFQAPASVLRDMLIAAAGPRGLGDPPLDGWIVESARQGATLLVKEVAPRAEAGMAVAIRPYCGMNGGLDGYYFPAKAR